MRHVAAWLARQWATLRYRWLLWLFQWRLKRAKYQLGKALLPALHEVAEMARKLAEER